MFHRKMMVLELLFCQRILVPIIFVTLMTSSLLSIQFAVGQSALPSGITLTTNERIYTPGERIVIKGIVHPPVMAGNLLLLTILTPENDFYQQDKSEITSDGEFTRILLLPQNAEPGEWKIRALFADKENEITFAVMEYDTSFDRLVIDGLILTDSQGNEIDGRDPLNTGQNIQVEGKLISDEEESEQPFTLIAQIIDNQSGMVVSLKFTVSTLAAGQTASPSIQWTPEKEGKYVIEVFVWSSLDGPSPLTQKQTLTVDVT
jgi:hypothetical protein